MSEYGFKVYSSQDGSLLINSDWQSLAFAGKAVYSTSGVTTSVSGPCYWQRYRAPAGFDASNPPSVFYTAAVGRRFGHDRMEWVAPYWYIYFNSTPTNIAGNIEVYCFLRMGTLSPSGASYGLQVWNADGQLAYDSGLPYKMLRVRSIPSAVSSPGGSITIPAGFSKPAIMLHSHYIRVLKSSEYYVYCYGLNTTFTSFTLINLVEVLIDAKFYPNGYSGGGGIWNDGRVLSVPIIDGAYYD